MLDKIKQYFVAASGWIVALLGGIIFFLVEKNNRLQGKLGQAEAEADLRTSLLKGQEEEKQADDEENSYRALRDEYLKQSGNGSGQGPKKD